MRNLGLWPADSNNQSKKTKSKNRKKEAGNDQDSFISDDDSDDDYKKVENFYESIDKSPPLRIEINSQHNTTKGTPVTPNEVLDPTRNRNRVGNPNPLIDMHLLNSPVQQSGN